MNPLRTLFAGLCAALALALAASAHAHGDAKHAGPVTKEQKPWGIAGELKPGVRTVELRMLDTMRFAPDRIAVREGETVRLALRNTGKLLHELVIGTHEELQAHAALMLRFPGMEHDEPYMAHVPAGRRGTIVWTFNRPGEFHFACLIPGHYQGGMVGTIIVAPATPQPK